MKQSVRAEAFKLYYLQWEHVQALGSELCQSPPCLSHGVGAQKTPLPAPFCWGMEVFRHFPELTSILQTDVHATATLHTRL